MIRKNPWVLSTFVLGIVVLMFLIGNFSGGITGNIVGTNEVEGIFLNYLEKIGANVEDVEITKISSKSGLYEISFDYKEESYPVQYYLTKDSSLIGVLSPIITETSSNEVITSEPTFTEEQNILIQEFSSCLYEKGMRVYYAGWCGHCHTLIKTFGGLENAGEIMIECQTENQQPGKDADLCATEDIKGFPTIKINDEPYEGYRTFEAFAEATGCTAPQL